MLSKKEIEKAKRYFEDELHYEKTTYNCVNHYRQTIIDNHIVLYKYINQLESDKQKLIEKLEKKIRYYEENDEILATSNDNYSDGTVIKKFIDEFREILSILKGE